MTAEVENTPSREHKDAASVFWDVFFLQVTCFEIASHIGGRFSECFRFHGVPRSTNNETMRANNRLE
jgi:hypothetical protein